MISRYVLLEAGYLGAARALKHASLQDQAAVVAGSILFL